MKRTGLMTALLLLVVVVFAQVNVKETTVVPPKFIGTEELNMDAANGYSPICNFIMEDLAEIEGFNQGVVVVKFIIQADGTLTDFDIVNSVSTMADQSVVSCLKKTSGMWQPGMVNEVPRPMEKEMQVKFIDPNSIPLELIAQQKLEYGLKLYYSAQEVLGNFSLTNEKAERKADKKIKKAIRFISEANGYLPNEPSFIFWQACAYEFAGDELNKGERLNRFGELVNLNYQAQIELVDIVLR